MLASRIDQELRVSNEEQEVAATKIQAAARAKAARVATSKRIAIVRERQQSRQQSLPEEVREISYVYCTTEMYYNIIITLSIAQYLLSQGWNVGVGHHRGFYYASCAGPPNCCFQSFPGESHRPLDMHLPLAIRESTRLDYWPLIICIYYVMYVYVYIMRLW